MITTTAALLVATLMPSAAEYEIRMDKEKRVLSILKDGGALNIRSLNHVPVFGDQGAEILGAVTSKTGYDFVLYRCGEFVLLDKLHKAKASWDKPIVVTNMARNFTKFEISESGDDAYVSGYKGERLIIKFSCLHSQLIFEGLRNQGRPPGVPLPDVNSDK